MNSNNSFKSSKMIGNRIVLTQYAGLLEMSIATEEWTELRLEMAKALKREDRVLMPGIKRAELIQTPDMQKLHETPSITVSIEGHDGRLYEWEATLHMANNSEGFESVGQVHMISEPSSEFQWIPSVVKGSRAS